MLIFTRKKKKISSLVFVVSSRKTIGMAGEFGDTAIVVMVRWFIPSFFFGGREDGATRSHNDDCFFVKATKNTKFSFHFRPTCAPFWRAGSNDMPLLMSHLGYMKSLI